MARSPNCTGAPLFKGRVDVTITYPDPDIQTLDTPEALPTSEPATAQVSMTVASSHLATWTPFELEHVSSALLCATGKNTSDSAITVYYRVEKNGASIATGSRSVPAGYFYTWNHFCFPDVNIGDVLTCRLWASMSGCDWRKKLLNIVPSRIGPKGQSMANVVWVIASRKIGNGGGNSNAIAYPFPDQVSVAKFVTLSAGTNSAPLWFSHYVYGLIKSPHDSNSSLCNPNESKDLIVFYAYIPTRISYTPLNLRV